MKPDEKYYVPGVGAPPVGERRRLRPDDALKLGIVPEGSARSSEGYLLFLECLVMSREPNLMGLSEGEVVGGFNHSLWRVFRGELNDRGIF